MNTSSKSTLSRVIAMIVTFVVLVTTLATTVSAATVSYSWNTSSLPYFNGYGTVKAQYVTKFEISDQKYYGFCIEPNKNMNGSTYISSYSEEDWDAYSNANKSFIALCCYYGYPNASTGNAYYYATQMLIWEIVGGYRTCDTSDSSSFADCDVNFVKKTSYWSRVGLSEATVLTAYNNIVTKVSRHYQTPESILDDNNESILYSTKSKAQDNAYQMTYNFTNKRYEVTFKVPKAYVNSSNSYAYSDLYDDIGDNEYLSISKTSTTSYIKYTVYTKAEFSGTATISTTQQVASVSTDKNIILSWNHAGTQTLISGAASPSAQTAYISFQTPDNPNLKVFKKFTLNGKNVGTDEDTIKDYCDDCKFLVKTSINGEKNYVKFTDNGDGTWTFKGFTTEKSSATYVTPIVTQKSDGYYYGYFALMDLPANVSSTRKYYIVETSGPDAFTLAPTKLATLSSLSDGTTNSYTITNSGTSNYGSVSITKEIADANGNTIRAAADNVDEIAEIYGDTKFVVAMRLSGEYGTITLADGTTASAGDWVYLAGSVCKNPANWSSHALKDEGVEAYSAGDGAYYMNTILDGSFTNGMCANPDYLTTDISEASVFTVGHTYTVNSDGSIDYGDHFGEIFIDGAMLNSKGAVPEMIFIEVEHADGYGLTNVDMSTSYELDEFNDIADTAAERRQFVGSVVTGYDSNYENLAQPAVATVIVNNEGVSEGVEPLLNYSMPMELRIKKTDADTEEPIEGAIYGLYSTKSTSSKYLLESATTNSNGVATFSYKLTYNNTYYVREISSPSGYTLDTTWYEVTDSTLTSEHISKSIFLNIDEFSSALTKITYVTDEPYKLQIQIDKEDDENDIAIEGAVFAIITNQDLTSEETAKIVIGGSGLTSGSSNLDKSAANKAYSEGDVIAYLTTDSKGYAEINGLPLGEYDDDKDEFAYSYTIQETEVPEPYVIDEETYEVSGISESDISIAQTSRWNMALCSFTYNAVNYPETVKVTVTKTGYDDEPVEGVVFDVYAAEDIILSNTTLYSAGDYIGSLSATDSDGRGYSEYEIEADTLAGTATVTLPIYVGFNYYILEDESTVPDGYVASTEKYEFTAAYGGVTVDSVEISMTIPNDYTKVHFTKYEITGEHELEGAILQVIDSDGNVIEEWTSTTEDPEIIATLVAGETYTLHEEVAPNGYVIANDIEFTVSTDGSVDVVEMYDDTTKVQITKYDITNGEELEGAELVIYDSEGNVVDEWVSTTEAHYIEGELIAGETYTLHEEVAPNGYVVASDIEFTVSTDGSVDVVEMYDDTTKVQITKYDITNGEELEGASLQVLDSDGNVVDEWVSTTEAHYIEGELIAGETYTLHEEVAPNGYVVASDIEFTVSTDGSVDVVEMYDDIMTGTLEVHKTTEGMLNVEGISFVLSGTSDVGIEVELTAVTDENGIATFEAVPIGTYTITEDSETTPYAYLTADAVEVQVYYAQTTTQEVYNNEKTGTLEVHKTTEDMTNIEGIDFVLSGTSDSGREIEITATTDANGIAEFENIPIGTYTITEDGDTVPYGYLTADDVSVEVYYAETTVQEVYNEEIPETETDTPKTPNLKTGTALLGTASLLGVVILVISFRKKKNE